MNFRDEDEMLAVAGEYVLGMLSPAENEDIEREMLRNHALAVAVGYWRDRLLVLVPPATAVQPASSTWARIRREINSAPDTSAGPGWWNNLFFWRAGSIAGLLATLVLSLYLVFAVQGEEERYLAVLQPPATGAAWLVQIDARSVRLRPLAPVTLPAGRSVQFWTKPAGAAAPTSLGLVKIDGATVVPARVLPGIGADQLFEVTLEPESGSPTGRPTGPILAVGTAVPL